MLRPRRICAFPPRRQTVRSLSRFSPLCLSLFLLSLCLCVSSLFMHSVITKLSGKRKLMEKMHHKNAKIAKQALLAVQKLMVNNW